MSTVNDKRYVSESCGEERGESVDACRCDLRSNLLDSKRTKHQGENDEAYELEAAGRGHGDDGESGVGVYADSERLHFILYFMLGCM